MQSLRAMSAMRLITNGKVAGQIVQGLPSDDLTRLEGIWCDPGFGGIRFIEAEHICSIGEGIVIAENTGVHLRIRPKGIFIRAISPDGSPMGAIVDALIDETSLVVRRLMLAEGYFEYLFHGCIEVDSFRYDPVRRLVIISQKEQGQEESL